MTRDPEWDDASREDAYALWQDELERCPQCGELREVCGDPDHEWFPAKSVCYKTAVEQVAQRRWNDMHGDAKPDQSGFLPTDGTRVWVSSDELHPDDDFLGIG